MDKTIVRKLKRENRELKKRLDTIEDNVMAELQKVIDIYETRLAYVMDVYTGGVLDDDTIVKWGKDKKFAIVADENQKGMWKVVVEDVGPEDEQSGPDEHAGSECEEGSEV